MTLRYRIQKNVLSSLGLIDARTNYGSNISNSASENEQPVLTYRRVKFTNRKHTSVKIIVVFKIFHRCLFATWIKPFGSDLCISISCSVDCGFEQVSANSFVTGHIILPLTKVIIDKSRLEASLLEQDTIENNSQPIKKMCFFFQFFNFILCNFLVADPTMF